MKIALPYLAGTWYIGTTPKILPQTDPDRWVPVRWLYVGLYDSGYERAMAGLKGYPR